MNVHVCFVSFYFPKNPFFSHFPSSKRIIFQSHHYECFLMNAYHHRIYTKWKTFLRPINIIKLAYFKIAQNHEKLLTFFYFWSDISVCVSLQLVIVDDGILEKHKYSLMHVLCKLHRLFRFASISSLSSSSRSLYAYYTHTLTWFSISMILASVFPRLSLSLILFLLLTFV